MAVECTAGPEPLEQEMLREQVTFEWAYLSLDERAECQRKTRSSFGLMPAPVPADENW
jgi:hypothetical protein